VRFAWIDERPFGYVDDSGLVGCDVSLARWAIRSAGEAFEPVHTTFGELLTGLTDGRWDVTTGMFVTEERAAVAHFTHPIWSLADGLLVAADEDRVSGYGDVARLGLRLAVLRDQVQVDHALEHGVSPQSLVLFETYDEAAGAVLRGEVPAYASVALAHQEHLAARGDRRARLVRVPPHETAPSVGAFACGSTQIRDALNAHLAALVRVNDPPEPSPDPATWVEGAHGPHH
jgi:polar amino acid transport system substrate-binding protein